MNTKRISRQRHTEGFSIPELIVVMALTATVILSSMAMMTWVQSAKETVEASADFSTQCVRTQSYAKTQTDNVCNYLRGKTVQSLYSQFGASTRDSTLDTYFKDSKGESLCPPLALSNPRVSVVESWTEYKLKGVGTQTVNAVVGGENCTFSAVVSANDADFKPTIRGSCGGRAPKQLSLATDVSLVNFTDADSFSNPLALSPVGLVNDSFGAFFSGNRLQVVAPAAPTTPVTSFVLEEPSIEAICVYRLSNGQTNKTLSCPVKFAIDASSGTEPAKGCKLDTAVMATAENACKAMGGSFTKETGYCARPFNKELCEAIQGPGATYDGARCVPAATN